MGYYRAGDYAAALPILTDVVATSRLVADRDSARALVIEIERKSGNR